MLNFENLDKFMFPGVGKYNIPQIEPVTEYPKVEFIPINCHYKEKDPASKIIHFFVDDYQFVRYWKTPDQYINKFSQFKAICAPDFPPIRICRYLCRFITTIANIGWQHIGNYTA